MPCQGFRQQINDKPSHDKPTFVKLCCGETLRLDLTFGIIVELYDFSNHRRMQFSV